MQAARLDTQIANMVQDVRRFAGHRAGRLAAVSVRVPEDVEARYLVQRLGPHLDEIARHAVAINISHGGSLVYLVAVEFDR